MAEALGMASRRSRQGWIPGELRASLDRHEARPILTIVIGTVASTKDRRQFTPGKRGRTATGWVNEAIAMVAGRQDGNVARWQLLKLVNPGNVIDRRLRSGSS